MDSCRRPGCTGELSARSQAMLQVLRQLRDEKRRRLVQLTEAVEKVGDAGRAAVDRAINHARHCSLGG